MLFVDDTEVHLMLKSYFIDFACAVAFWQFEMQCIEVMIVKLFDAIFLHFFIENASEDIDMASYFFDAFWSVIDCVES